MNIEKTQTLRNFLPLGITFLILLNSSSYADQFVVVDQNRITDIGKISILPIVTLANLPEGREGELIDQVRRDLALELAIKGYTLKREKVFSRTRELTSGDVAAMPPKELASLGPDNATHLLLLFINAFETSRIVIANSSNAKLAAILIDKTTAEVLWKNEVDQDFETGFLSLGSGGLIGMLVFDEDAAAIWLAFKALFKDFPERPM